MSYKAKVQEAEKILVAIRFKFLKLYCAVVALARVQWVRLNPSIFRDGSSIIIYVIFRCKSSIRDAIGQAKDDPEDSLGAGVDLFLPTPLFD